jgi:hypothetical protein
MLASAERIMPLTEKLDAPAEPVVPDPERPATAGPPDKVATEAKFSDLAAFHQSLQTRLALALAAFALTATAARPVAELLPPRVLSNGAVPFLVYAASFTFISGIFSIAAAVRTPPPLQNEIVSRLASRALTSVDETSPKLQRLYIGDITLKVEALRKAYRNLSRTYGLLWLFAIFSVGFAFFESYPEVSKSSATFDSLRSAQLGVVSFLERHNMAHLGLYLERPAAVLLFEATNIFGIILIINREKRARAFRASHIEEAEG